MVVQQNSIFEAENVFIHRAKANWEEAHKLYKDHMLLMAENKRLFIRQCTLWGGKVLGIY